MDSTEVVDDWCIPVSCGEVKKEEVKEEVTGDDRP
jgi:hypothetical protein